MGTQAFSYTAHACPLSSQVPVYSQHTHTYYNYNVVFVDHSCKWVYAVTAQCSSSASG